LGIAAAGSFVSSQYQWDPVLLVCALFACIVGRLFNIFPLSALANLRRKTKVSFKTQTIMWFAGLRGAIAFALALNVTTSGRPEIVTTTLFLVLFTTLVLGSTTTPLLSRLGLLLPAQPTNRSLVDVALDKPRNNAGKRVRRSLHPSTPVDISEEEEREESRDMLIASLDAEDASDQTVEQTTSLLHSNNNDDQETAAGGSNEGINRKNDLRKNDAGAMGFVHRTWQMIDERFMKPMFGGKARRGYAVVM